jgi:hypothetical protein
VAFTDSSQAPHISLSFVHVNKLHLHCRTEQHPHLCNQQRKQRERLVPERVDLLTTLLKGLRCCVLFVSPITHLRNHDHIRVTHRTTSPHIPLIAWKLRNCAEVQYNIHAKSGYNTHYLSPTFRFKMFIITTTLLALLPLAVRGATYSKTESWYGSGFL